jgi:hypothetical protein
MAELYRSKYYVLSTTSAAHVLLVRTAVSYPTIEEQLRDQADLIGALRRSGFKRLLVDLRGGGTGRNDPEFEAAGENLRKEMARIFERVAAVVRSAAGKLQVQRLSRSHTGGSQPPLLVTQDEAEALKHLAG